MIILTHPFFSVFYVYHFDTYDGMREFTTRKKHTRGRMQYFPTSSQPRIIVGMTVDEKIDALRSEMSAAGYDAWIVTSADPHAGEYVPARWQTRAWLTGFDGSAGTAVVTTDKAGLWVDSRYYLAAEIALTGTGITLYKSGLPEVPDFPEWLNSELSDGSRVGFDESCFTVHEAKTLSETLSPARITVAAGSDPFDTIWSDRPARPRRPVRLFETECIGTSRAKKLDEIRAAVRGAGATHCLVTALDEIVYTLNVRGEDIPFNPVTIAYLLIAPAGATLFIDTGKLDADAEHAVTHDSVETAPYEAIFAALRSMPDDACIVFDPAKTNTALRAAIGDTRIIEKPSPVERLKAIKSESELACLDECSARDGAALVEFLAWLEETVPVGPVTELAAADRLEQFRRDRGGYLEPSFTTISGSGPNGAVVHYSARPDTQGTLAVGVPYLVDSGAQYTDGTTDITRTVCIGAPPDGFRADFTHVLRAHIAVATARFPRGTYGYQIDAIARVGLWREGIQYGHGTGHGVGFRLNVHEGPQKMSPAPLAVALEKGMLISNEPGVYRTGQWGVRIENLVTVVDGCETEFGEFFAFRTVSFCPIQRDLIDIELLTDDEVAWIDEYHTTVRERLTPLLNKTHASWLADATAPLIER